MLANGAMGSLPPCQEPSQGLCVWGTLTTPERAGRSYGPVFRMGQCWEEAPFTRLRVLPGQVGTEAEPRYGAQSGILGKSLPLCGLQWASWHPEGI